MAKLDTESTHCFEICDVGWTAVIGEVTSPDDAVNFISELKKLHKLPANMTEFLVVFHTKCAHRIKSSGQLVSYTEKVQPVRKIYITADNNIIAKDI